MSPVAAKFQISEERHIGNINVPRPPYGSEQAPRSYEISRCRPNNLPDPELFGDATALFFMSHEPTSPLDDPIDGIGSLVIDSDGEAALILEFPDTTDETNRALFSNTAAQNVGDHFPGVSHLTVVRAAEASVLERIERVAA